MQKTAGTILNGLRRFFESFIVSRTGTVTALAHPHSRMAARRRSSCSDFPVAASRRLADLSDRLVLCLLRMDRRFRLICRRRAVLQFSDPLLQILYLLSQFRYFPVISGAVKCVTGFIGHQKQDQTRKKTAK